MFAKIEINGTIEIVTGLHIGGSSAFSAIGAVDSPVIKDGRTNMPMIPGSSLKGKIRTLLAKRYNNIVAQTPDDDAECLTRLFGSSKKGNIKTSKVLFSDMFIENMDELRQVGLTGPTEVKFENSIQRATAVANPRQIERVIRGSEFELELIYNVEDETQVQEDFEAIRYGLTLLEYDYLGGSGSRGYGKVKFEDLQAENVIGNLSDEVMQLCNEILSEEK